MAEENISQEFRLENIGETRNHLIEELNRNELMSKKHKKICRTVNYIGHFLILTSTITGCVSTFASLIRAACVAKVSERKVFDRTRTFIKDFRLFIKQCYRIV